MNSATPRIYTVSQLNGIIHDLLETGIPEIWVEGEISNCKTYPSGHTYLSLKDENAQIRAVLFKGEAMGLRFEPQDGLKVLARGRVSSYIKRGDLQLIISALEPREKGALQIAFEQLKAKLAEEGLFEESRKKSLPSFPAQVGIITSLAGAAVHDMVSVLSRRWPAVHILIYPVRVQGEGAKEEISQAIKDFNEYLPETGVLLVGRGGGSIEDLWAFNEEIVARAIAGSKIPIISCVGHETDFTIADFVADKRAPTPSAAAELAVPDYKAVFSHIAGLSQGLFARMASQLQSLDERLGRASLHPLLQSPHRLYEERAKRIDELGERVEEAMVRILVDARKDLRLQSAKLDAFSPLKVLGRGYAIAEKMPNLEILRSSRQVKPGDKVRVRLHEGKIYCEVSHEQEP